MPSSDLLFIHGGPGLNSNPERLILSGILQDQNVSAVFWDEPSLQRPQETLFQEESAYRNWLKSLQQAVEKYSPKVLVCESFGALACMDYMKIYRPTLDFKLLMISPTLDLKRLFLRMMELSEQDFAKTDVEKAAFLRKARTLCEEFWDQHMQEGLSLAWQNPNLANHYFVNKSILSSWASAYAEPPYNIDFSSQQAVLKDAQGFVPPPLESKWKKPVVVLTGEQDPVFNHGETHSILDAHFSSVEYKECPRTGHFPHLENPDFFMKLVEGLIKRT